MCVFLVVRPTRIVSTGACFFERLQYHVKVEGCLCIERQTSTFVIAHCPVAANHIKTTKCTVVNVLLAALCRSRRLIEPVRHLRTTSVRSARSPATGYTTVRTKTSVNTLISFLITLEKGVSANWNQLNNKFQSSF